MEKRSQNNSVVTNLEKQQQAGLTVSHLHSSSDRKKERKEEENITKNHGYGGIDKLVSRLRFQDNNLKHKMCAIFPRYYCTTGGFNSLSAVET
ncbi:CLUMA_CG012278, isoform A [Clunio marinus]|uniref:CLUMA_CG012278, isoform A n=1 Tax=Clunio marinus TaxID=568069 RepID=A0A1J1IEV9_9DIPT|nr:CLUMA_CG012278, isoform A [Clunio marinus]